MKPSRAWVLLPSRHKLNLLAPDPRAWTDRDVAICLSHTYRWAGYSAWPHPQSVAQHPLTVLALRRLAADRPLTAAEERRELLHDATEALLGGFDPITPIKPHLGQGYEKLVTIHQAGLDIHYALPVWDERSYREHKQADRLAAVSEGLRVVCRSRRELREDLEIAVEALDRDPLAPVQSFAPWEPWPATFAAERFLETLESLADPPGYNPRAHSKVA